MKKTVLLILSMIVVLSAAAQAAAVEVIAVPTDSVEAVVVAVDEVIAVPTDTLEAVAVAVDEVVALTPAVEERWVSPSHRARWGDFVVPAAVFGVSTLFIGTKPFVGWKEDVQGALSGDGKHTTKVDGYLRFVPMLVPYALDLCGVKGEHGFVDRTIILAMSYAVFAGADLGLKSAFREQRPDGTTFNSFPSGHTGAAVVGAEFLRREYWDKNKWIAMSGYAVALTVGYLRIYNNRHYINDVVAGAALGYLSTTFAYWLYPKIFRKREQMTAPYRRDTQAAWVATPFAGSGGYGIALNVVF